MSALPKAQKEVQPEKPMFYVHQGAAPNTLRPARQDKTTTNRR